MTARARHLCLLLATAWTASASAEPSAWQSADPPGELLFLPSYEGERLEGRFPEFDVSLRLAEADGAPATLEIRVTVGTADLQDDEANAELREPEWFDADAHPLARFSSDEIIEQDDAFLARGELEIRGIRQPLELPLRLERQADRLILQGQVELDRSRWGVGGGDWADDTALSEKVEVRYRAMLRPSSVP